MAHRALGFAAPAHAELAEPAARLRLSTATTPTATGRVPEVIDFIEDYAKAIAAPVETAHDA